MIKLRGFTENELFGAERKIQIIEEEENQSIAILNLEYRSYLLKMI